jgi:hypothetical protein
MTLVENARAHYWYHFTSNTASAIGAGAIGIGIGSILPRMPLGWPSAFLILGIAIHGVGMARTHRAGAKAGLTPPFWFQTITWLCCIILVGLAASVSYLFTT